MSKSKKIQIRPILLSGHTGPVQKVRYNRDGDLLFSCAKKDKKCMAWYSNTGERLGTYDGHEGMIYDVDTDFMSKHLLTASADRTAKIWEVETGKTLLTIEHGNTVRACGFAEGDKMILTLQDESHTSRMDKDSTIFIYNLDEDIKKTSKKPIQEFSAGGAKMIHAMWGSLNADIISCDTKGIVRKWDVETGKEICAEREHRDKINGMQFSYDKTMFVTASSDQKVKLWDAKTLKVMKEYHSDRPLNGCSISPRMNHVIVGGGQDARSVTTTSTRSGKFEVEFYHTVYQEYMGTIKGHFGPVNWLAFSPDGKSYVSGSEDGYIRIQHFDGNYLKTKEW